MGKEDEKRSGVMVNGAAVVAEVLRFEHEEALTLGRAVAGLNTYSKGVPRGSSSRPPKRSKNSGGRRSKKRPKRTKKDSMN